MHFSSLGGRRSAVVVGAIATTAAMMLGAPGGPYSAQAMPSMPVTSRAHPAARVQYSVGPITEVSAGCPGTGDIAEALDRARGYAYVEFEGCDHGNGMGFARSTNGGDSYSPAVALPGSHGGWDPWLAVAPDGTLYAAFMNTIDHETYPVIDVSRDHGRTFDVEQSLRPTQSHNFGDAEYLAIGRHGTLFVAWAYGPSNSEVKWKCRRNGSCWASNGDVNVAVQSSTNDAKSFTPISVVNPGYPDGGADEGDVTVTPSGAVDVLYQGYQVVNRRTLKLARGHEYFVSSTDGGRIWSAPVEVGASAGKMTNNEWWNDGYIATDPSGDLFATWDTQDKVQGHKADIGWLSFSSDGGRKWSPPLRATPDADDSPHIMEAAGGAPGEAYVAWLSSSDPRGYALYLRTYVIGHGNGSGGWRSRAVRISGQFGDPDVFPGDTFGIATFYPEALVLSWGSAVPGSGGKASVFAAPVEVKARQRS